VKLGKRVRARGWVIEHVCNGWVTRECFCGIVEEVVCGVGRERVSVRKVEERGCTNGGVKRNCGQWSGLSESCGSGGGREGV